MQAVDYVGRDVNCGVEAESHARAPNIVVDRFWQTDDVQSLFGKQICRFVRAIAAKSEQTVQLLVLISFLHISNFVNIILFNYFHHFKRRALCAEDRTAGGQNSRKI